MKKMLMSVDLGSTGVKAVVFDLSGREIYCAKRPAPVYKDEEGYYYGAKTLWDICAGAISEAAAACGGEICGVAVTGMGNDGVSLDGDGNETYPFISWKCDRVLPYFERFMADFGRERYFMATGIQARPVDAFYKLMWLRDKHPGRFAATKHWLMIEDYVNYKLSGEMVSDHTVMFTSGLYDPMTEDWSDEVLKASGLSADIMPSVKGSGTVIGGVTKAAAEETGLKAGTPVALGGWDIICSSLAVGAYKEGVAMDIMGTWETLLVPAGEYTRTKEMFKLGLNACHHVATGMYSYPCYFVSSAMVEWFIQAYFKEAAKGLNDIEVYKTLASEAESVMPGCGGAMFLPHIYGASAPMMDGRSRGAFAGLTDSAGRPEMAMAVFEGLSFICDELAAGCEAFTKEGLKKFIVCGGGMRNAAWCKIKADMLGRDLTLCSINESTALGAALKAGVGIGVYANDGEAVSAVSAGREDGHIEYSEERRAEYARLKPLFSMLYGQLKEMNHAIYSEWEGKNNEN